MGNRILVVDDDPDTVVYLSSFLEDHGFQTAAAHDASEALAVLEEFDPDAVLVDVMMPGRSGLDLLVRIRRSERFENVPILVVTGNDHILADDFRSYLGSHHGVRGPDGVVGKPVDAEALLRLVRSLTNEAEQETG